MKIVKIIFLLPIAILFCNGCNHNANDSQADVVEAKTPVTLTNISIENISDSISLNAVSSFLKKNSLKSSAVGFVDKVNIKLGDYVEKGQVLFSVKTKEAAAFTSKSVDSILNFNGSIPIVASSAGIVSELNKQTGDYVADGDQLCMIAQKNSLVFLLNVPFEMNRFVKLNSVCTIELPDNSHLSGKIESKLSSVNPISQTQSYIVKTKDEKNLPENLIAEISVLKTVKKNAITLPKAAILSDETEENFWVMKMINDSTAVKVPIIKGLESDSKVEIITPHFSNKDKIVLAGNYGLADTALVQPTTLAAHE